MQRTRFLRNLPVLKSNARQRPLLPRHKHIRQMTPSIRQVDDGKREGIARGPEGGPEELTGQAGETAFPNS